MKKFSTVVLLSTMTVGIIGVGMSTTVIAEPSPVVMEESMDENYREYTDYLSRSQKTAQYAVAPKTSYLLPSELVINTNKETEEELKIVIPDTTYVFENGEIKEVSKNVEVTEVLASEKVEEKKVEQKVETKTSTKTQAKKSTTTQKKTTEPSKKEVKTEVTTQPKVEEITEAVTEEVTTEEVTTESRTEVVTEEGEEVTTEAPTTEEPTTEVKVEEKKEETKVTGYASVSLSDKEIYMLAQLIYLEAGNCSYKCQCAVGSVAINLMLANGCSLSSVAHNKNMFSVASRVDRTTPSDTALKAARQIATSGTTVPRSVKCFRNNHYFSWAKPYMNIDNVYFGSF